MDIVNIRLMAHFDYLIPRMHDEKSKMQLKYAMVALCAEDFEYFKKENSAGSKLALDIYREILQIHIERFEEGRTGDAYLEKL